MTKDRLTAFSDGVLAIIITIMVLELKAPHSDQWDALLALAPVFFSYLLSFIYVAIYWHNHHHMLHTVKHVTGGILWANTHLLFWLSLIPFATAWTGENHFSALPTAVYGVALLMPAVSYYILQHTIIAAQGENSVLAKAIGSDVKGKISLVIYAVSVGAAFIDPRISYVLYIIVAILWLVPDRRIERVL